MRVLRHVSWFSDEELKGKDIIVMCKFCGNSDPKVRDCHSCDIGFTEYIYIEDTGGIK